VTTHFVITFRHGSLRLYHHTARDKLLCPDTVLMIATTKAPKPATERVIPTVSSLEANRAPLKNAALPAIRNHVPRFC
jgi:hypothetical protein